MTRFLSILICILLLSCSNEKTLDYKVSIKKSSVYVADFMESHQVPGMQIAVAHKGRLVWSEGFGYANVELGIPVSTKSKFRIASVSKPVTAVLTAYLYQKGVINIDQPVNSSLGGFTNTKWDFTVRQLMSHAAGIRHYLPQDTNSIQYHNDLQNGLNIIKSDTLLFEPNSRFCYSSYGYNIIGAYLEKVTDESFENLLVDSLFTRINMANSTIDHPYRIIPERTTGYQLDEMGEVINAHFFDNRYKIPAGGILSTSEDLVRFGNEILYGDYLNEQSKKLLFTPFEYRDEKESDTGFGWVTTKDDRGNMLYGHLGGITGGCSAIMIYPEKELIVIWLGNLDADWSDVPIKTIANFFLDGIGD